LTLQEQRDDLLPTARGGGQPRLEGAALDELEREVDLPGVGPGLEHLQHVRVRDLGHRLGLAQQAAMTDRVRRGDPDALVQQLDRDLAIEVVVVGRIDHAHAGNTEPGTRDMPAPHHGWVGRVQH